MQPLCNLLQPPPDNALPMHEVSKPLIRAASAHPISDVTAATAYPKYSYSWLNLPTPMYCIKHCARTSLPLHATDTFAYEVVPVHHVAGRCICVISFMSVGTCCIRTALLEPVLTSTYGSLLVGVRACGCTASSRLAVAPGVAVAPGLQRLMTVFSGGSTRNPVPQKRKQQRKATAFCNGPSVSMRTQYRKNTNY
jgi:hypothetical protein